VICISGVLHHFPDQLESAFVEIDRCATKAICIIEPSTTSPLFFVRLIRFIHKLYKWIYDRLFAYCPSKYTYSIFERPLNPEMLKRLLEKHGFTIRSLIFFNHIPLPFVLSERLHKHFIQSLLSFNHGTDVEIIATKN